MNYYLKVLKNYAVFNGRARRSEYWYFVLFNIIASIIFGVMDGVLGTIHAETQTGLFGTIYGLGVLIPGLAVAIRRMHDVGKSGWFVLIPIYNLILACTDGEKGPNQYGPDPKNPEADITDHLVA